MDIAPKDVLLRLARFPQPEIPTRNLPDRHGCAASAAARFSRQFGEECFVLGALAQRMICNHFLPSCSSSQHFTLPGQTRTSPSPHEGKYAIVFSFRNSAFATKNWPFL